MSLFYGGRGEGRGRRFFGGGLGWKKGGFCRLREGWKKGNISRL
jgi:hypothetical protein